MTARTRNFAAAVLVLLVSAYWYVEADGFRPLSRIFPQVVAGIVFVSALVLAVLTLVGHGPVIAMAAGDSGTRHMRSGTLMGALVLWTALVPLVGLLAAGVVGVIVMGLITFRGHHGTTRAIIVALVSVSVFYALFRYVLFVPFPTGIFG
ncbi:MAG: tripartite tricarboxylate transporter TctB family protein [Alkalispirochaeta sp.]